MAAALNPNGLKLAEFARSQYRVVVDNEVAHEDVLKPEFWVHVASKLQITGEGANPLIEVMPKDGSWFALLIVVSASNVHAKCVSVLYKQLEKKAVTKKMAEDPDFDVKNKGGDKKFTIIRKADKAIVKEGFNTGEEALFWLDENRNDLVLA